MKTPLSTISGLARPAMAAAVALALTPPARAESPPLGIFGGDLLKQKLAETEERLAKLEEARKEAEAKLAQEAKARGEADEALRQTQEALQTAQAELNQAVNRCKAEKAEVPPAPPERAKAPAPLASLPVPEMIRIEGGSFATGCEKTNHECDAGASSLHPVTVNAFELGKYELTFAEWDACEAAESCPHIDDDGWGRGQRPVINVSWNDAQAYLKWLNSLPGQTKQYRLPSETEWQYAALAGMATPLSTGKCGSGKAANHGGGSDGNRCGTKAGLYLARTQAKGRCPANPWDLQDMNGNVSEWTHHSENPSDPEGRGQKGGSRAQPAILRLISPGPSDKTCAKRVLRGGFGNDAPGKPHPPEPGRLDPATRIKFASFRLARSITP